MNHFLALLLLAKWRDQFDSGEHGPRRAGLEGHIILASNDRAIPDDWGPF